MRLVSCSPKLVTLCGTPAARAVLVAADFACVAVRLLPARAAVAVPLAPERGDWAVLAVPEPAAAAAFFALAPELRLALPLEPRFGSAGSAGRR